MAGKHSKNLFKKDGVSVNVVLSGEHRYLLPVSLPFKIIIAVTVISLILSAVFVGVYFVPDKAHSDILKNAANVFENAVDYDKALQTLSQDNSDIKGWLKIDGTDINCAVCHTDNDTYYINHNQLGKKSRYGALFLSSSDSFERTDNDRNIVIYGNNIKNGSMFGTLKKYRNVNFYKQNPTVSLYYSGHAETYIIFAVMLIGSSQNDAGTTYNPSRSHFSNENEFAKWYKETAQRSLINTTVAPQYGDDLLTLVTTADDFDGARLVVMAKKTTEWDASHTDVTGAGVNDNIKYPEIWYKERGLTYPY